MTGEALQPLQPIQPFRTSSPSSPCSPTHQKSAPALSPSQISCCKVLSKKFPGPNLIYARFLSNELAVEPLAIFCHGAPRPACAGPVPAPLSPSPTRFYPVQRSSKILVYGIEPARDFFSRGPPIRHPLPPGRVTLPNIHLARSKHLVFFMFFCRFVHCSVEKHIWTVKY